MSTRTRSPLEVDLRKDAALIARVWRRVPIEGSRLDNNRRARLRARLFIDGLLFQRGAGEYVIQHQRAGSTEWCTLPGTFPDRCHADRRLLDLGGQEQLDPTGSYRVVEAAAGSP